MSMDFNDTTTHQLTLPPSFKHLERQLRAKISETIASSSKLRLSKDRSFGALGAIAGFVRSAQSGEGYLIERGAAALIRSTGRYLVFKDIRIPGPPEHDNEDEAFVAPGSSKRRGKKPSKRGYRPDLVLVDQATHAIYMIEVKRTSESYMGWQLGTLAKRMESCSPGLVRILKDKYSGLQVTTVDVVILDASDSDRNKVVTRISSLDDVLGIDDLASAIAWLRQEYAAAVQDAFLAKISEFYSRRAQQLGIPPLALVRDDALDELSGLDVDGRAFRVDGRDDDQRLRCLGNTPTVRVIGNLG